MRKFLFLIGSVAFLASCSNEDSIIDDSQKIKKIHVDFSLSVDDDSDDTRAYFKNLTDETWPVRLTVGESVRVIASGSNMDLRKETECLTVYEIPQTDFGKYANVSGDITESTVGYNIISPTSCNPTYVDDTHIDLVIPSTQQATPNAVDPDAMILVAHTTNFNQKINMAHITSYFRVEIKSNDITCIKLEPTNEAYSIAGALRVIYENDAIGSDNTANTRGSHTVELKNGGSPIPVGTYAIALRPGYYNNQPMEGQPEGGGLQLTISYSTEGKKPLVKKTTMEVLPGHWYDMGEW